MAKTGKKGFFGNHAKSSAAMVSLGIHAVLIVVAISFVAVRVYVKNEQVFEAKPVSRPNMKLKKLTVPVDVKKKKVQKPKLRKTIVSKPKTKSMDIKMPEISGIKGGTGYMDGGGLGSIGFSLDIDLFGGSKGSGNELEGTFFDLKMDSKGKPSDLAVEITGDKAKDAELEKQKNREFVEVIRNFAGSWNPKRLEGRYFKAPKSKFATTFMVPYMKAEEAPKAYGVDDVVEPRRWVAYYNGKIAAPETGRYRFWGIADDILMVRIKGDLVIDANYPSQDLTNNKDQHRGRVTGWLSDDSRSRQFKSSKEQGYVIGDWFHMTKGRPIDMEVLIGELPGGWFYCRLLIEQEGVEYPKSADGRPILPVFKLQEIPENLLPQMKLDSGAATAEGPTFGVLK
ncbi:hypothetical protein P4C99_12840 [Pontiellaceae bacterium B1224]|nr:hypothetical protein [Pontiellaceae bacterium B1224]